MSPTIQIRASQPESVQKSGLVIRLHPWGECQSYTRMGAGSIREGCLGMMKGLNVLSDFTGLNYILSTPRGGGWQGLAILPPLVPHIDDWEERRAGPLTKPPLFLFDRQPPGLFGKGASGPGPRHGHKGGSKQCTSRRTDVGQTTPRQNLVLRKGAKNICRAPYITHLKLAAANNINISCPCPALEKRANPMHISHPPTIDHDILTAVLPP